VYYCRWKNSIRMDFRENKLGRCVLDSSGLGQGPVESSCERGNEPSGPIRGEEFFDQLDVYQLLKDSAPCSSLVDKCVLLHIDILNIFYNNNNNNNNECKFKQVRAGSCFEVKCSV